MPHRNTDQRVAALHGVNDRRRRRRQRRKDGRRFGEGERWKDRRGCGGGHAAQCGRRSGLNPRRLGAGGEEEGEDEYVSVQVWG